jgi:hypothetical protein
VTHSAKKIRHILVQRVADEEAARDLLSRQQHEQQQQPVESVESAEDIVQRLVSILARAEIFPVDKRVQFAKALYDMSSVSQTSICCGTAFWERALTLISPSSE